MKATAAAPRSRPQESPALLERAEAVAAVRRAVAGGRNLLVHGPAGVGKSTLLRAAFADAARQPLYCSAAAAADLYRGALAGLAALGHTAAAGALGRRVPLSSVGCRGVLERALAGGRYCLVLDPAPMASRALANELRQMLRTAATPLLAAAASQHMDDVGCLAIFFTLQSEKLRLAPLSEAAARQFAAAEMERLGAGFDDAERVLPQLLHFAKGAPGAIRAMIEMTRQPRYRFGNQLKIHSLYLAWLTGDCGGVQP